ncbi:MAG: FAD-binding protein, partial [Myxococcales bacterium]
MSTAPPASVPAPGGGASHDASDDSRHATGAPYDAIVIGAGPAGLAAAAHLAGGGARTLLVDAGQAIEARDHRDQGRLTSGVGGAGLYSDGKFSFHPAATALWSLDDEPTLRAAHEQVRERLLRPR